MSNYHIKHLEEYYQVYRKSVRNPEVFYLLVFLRLNKLASHLERLFLELELQLVRIFYCIDI